MSAKLGALNILLSVDAAQFSASLRKAGADTGTFANTAMQHLQQVSDTFERTAKNTQKLYGLSQIQAVAPILGLQTRQALQLADAFGQYSSRLKQATDSTAEYNAIAAQLMDTSNRTFKSYEDAYELFIRTSGAMKQLGYTAQEVADLVSTVQFGLTVDSADSQKTQSAINAISGAILEGRLNMQKFNTIVAASPSLFQALADNIAGGSQQALRQMVASGQVTAKELLSIRNSMVKLGEQADEMPTTVADAMTKLRNQFAQFAGQANESLGVSQKLANVLGFVGANVDILSTAVATFAALHFARKLSEQAQEAWNATKSLDAQTKALLSNTLAKYDNAKTAEALAKQEYQLAEKAVQVATSLSAETDGIKQQKLATEALARAKSKLEKATQATSVAAANLSKVNDRVRSSATTLRRAMTLLGGAFGVFNIALTVAASAWAFFQRQSEQATKSIMDVTKPVKDLREEFSKLARSQQALVVADLSREIEKIAKPAEEARKRLFGILSDNKWQWQSRLISENIKPEIDKILQDSALSVQELDTRLRGVLQRFAETPFRYSSRPLLYQSDIERSTLALGRLVTAQQALNEAKNKVRDLKKTMDGTADSARTMGAALQLQGMADWDKYVGTLQEAQATVGMTARQLAEFKARQAGANDAQAQTAGLIAAQTELYHQLKKAIEDGDSASQHRITHQLEGLTAERAALEGGLQAYSQLDATLARLQRNTQRRAKVDNGKNELAEFTKNLQAQIDTYGMNEQAQQRHKIAQMQGTKAAKDNALALVDKIALMREEAETLRFVAQEQEAAYALVQSFVAEQVGQYANSEALAEYLKADFELREEYARRILELQRLQEDEQTRISQEAYDKRLQVLQDSLEAQRQALAQAHKEKQRLEGDWVHGFKKGFAEFGKDAGKTSEMIAQVTSNHLGKMADAVASFVSTGKADFASLAESIIQDLTRIAVQQAIVGIVRMATGAPMASPVGYATGGLVLGPGTSTSDSIPTMLSNGEFVINAKATKDNLALLYAINAGRRFEYRAHGGPVGRAAATRTPGAMAHGGGGHVTVNITNNGSQPVGGRARINMDQMGNQVIDIVLADIQRNGRLGQHLKSRGF